MKHFFGILIERCKNLLTSLTIGQKIKYGIITGLVFAIAITVVVVTALNTNEPEPVQDPIETYDKVSVIPVTFDEETTDETDAESALESETVDESESSKVTSQKETETAEISSKNEETSDAPSESVTDSQGEDPQPADPSGDNVQTDPEPAVTTSKQTQSTTVQAQSTTKLTQSTSKPTESTTKAQQTAPQPVESTTAKQTQSDPRPVETTAKQTQAQTKPVETTKKEDIPSQSNGQFVVSEKKYDYNGANVMILNVENQSSSAYTLTIVGHFNDKNGKELKSETRVFEGFPANYSNYFVFQPGIKFDNFTYELKTSSYSGPAYAQYITTGSDVKVVAQPALMDQMNDTQRAELKITISISSSRFEDLFYTTDFVLLDNKGQIAWIAEYPMKHIINSDPNKFEGKKDIVCTYDDILYENYVMPESLKNNCKGLIGIIRVTDQ